MIPSKQRSGWQYWEVAELLRDGMLEIGDGYRAKNSEMGISGLPFARAGNVNNGFHFDDADILSKESVRIAGDKLSRPGDITFTSKGTFGRFAFVRQDTPPFVYSPQLCYWRVKKDGVVERRFLYYWMQGADCMNQLNEVKGLTDMADYVSLTNQRKMWLSAPPLPLQRRIASILSAYDDLIENNQRRIKILEEMARSLYREWFVHFRFPGHDKVKMVPSPLGPIPQGWEVKNVKEVLARRPAGQVYREEDVALEGAVPVIDQSTNELLGFHDNEPDHLATPENPIAIFGDHTCKMQLLVEPFSIGPNVLAFAANIDRPISYLFNIVRSLIQTQEYKRHWTQLTAKEILLADKSTAEHFATSIQPSLQQVEVLRKTNRVLRRTRDLLLPRLLSGEVNLPS